jgi:hypothetical protein
MSSCLQKKSQKNTIILIVKHKTRGKMLQISAVTAKIQNSKMQNGGRGIWEILR